jgi:transposase InsO family protein
MDGGLTGEAAAKAVGVPRATLYRWERQPKRRSSRPHRVRCRNWPSALVRAVERLRQDYPMWGRAKLGPIVRAEGFAVSDATVGRIIRSLVARGVVDPVPALRRRRGPRRWSAKRRFAVRLPRDVQADRPGSLVQLDTVFVNVAPDKAIKHFTAYDPVAKWTVAKAFNRATAASAAIFLDKLLRDMPFKVEAIQVDGGSEFMAEFEQACQDKGVRLYVLPPKCPQMNGAVERCNGAWRYEFYSVYDLPRNVDDLNPILDSFQHLYNPASQHPSGYVIEGKRLCWLECDPAGYLGFCRARSAIDRAADVASAERMVRPGEDGLPRSLRLPRPAAASWAQSAEASRRWSG